MALDGIVLSSLKQELTNTLVGGRIDKIAQPEKDEIIITIRNERTSYKLLLSAQASMPRIHITGLPKTNPAAPPSFCMLLRKHINNGKILEISQPNFERIIEMKIEHLNELGDICFRVLIIEIMGRHSNVILCDDQGKILDSMKRISHLVSSVREVYPGITYVYPPAQGKISPLDITSIDVFRAHLDTTLPLHKSLFMGITGFSPLIADELCFVTGLTGTETLDDLSIDQFQALYKAFTNLQAKIVNSDFLPFILQNNTNQFEDFHVLNLACLNERCQDQKAYTSVSNLIDDYYETKSSQSRVQQKSVDIRKLIQTNIDRASKKLDLQTQQMKDTEDLEKYKILGDLITSHIYLAKEGATSMEVYNYYTNENVTLKLDPQLTAVQNAQKQFSKYNKKKRTALALESLLEETKSELSHLESIKYALEVAEGELDLTEIRNELVESGYIRKRHTGKKSKEKASKPLHFINADGYHMYVGKNNLQNDMLTFKLANNSDWWFHAKGLPGSHVIVRAVGETLPDSTFETAAALAAYYSKANQGSKVAIDYTQKKNIKKPAGSAPGFVIYHTNYSMFVEPSINGLTKIED